MNTPTLKLSDQQPGDSEAVSNATRRAERLGATNPTVDAAKVRLALSDARDRDHLKQLLEAEGIEAEFDRRGQDQNVYGWRLRRRGSQEWLKASTVARDLSWPKIAHRLAESNTTKQSPAEQIAILASTYPSFPTQPQRQITDRPPQQLQPIPQSMHSAQQMHAQGPVVRRLGEVSQTLDDMAPAMNTLFLQSAWALSKVAIFCATAAAQLAAVVWKFVQRLLGLFGLKTNEPLQYLEQPNTPQLTYETVTHGRVLESDELESLDKNASDAIDHVLECVKSGRPNDLPEDVDDEGRAELVEAMTSTEKTGTPAVAQADPMDALFDDHQTPPAPKIEIEPVAAQPDTFVLLNTAKEEFFTASIKKSDARERETPQVTQARKNHELAVRRLKQAKLDYSKEKESKGRWAFLLPNEAVVIEAEQIAFDQAEMTLANAIKQHPTVVPPQLVQKFGDALEKVKVAAAVHHAQMLKDVDKFDNVKVKKIALYQAQSFKANFEIFERMRGVGYLDLAIKVAESAPNSIATAQTLAEREAKIQTEGQAYVPDGEHVDNIDRPGQK